MNEKISKFLVAWNIIANFKERAIIFIDKYFKVILILLFIILLVFYRQSSQVGRYLAFHIEAPVGIRGIIDTTNGDIYGRLGGQWTIFNFQDFIEWQMQEQAKKPPYQPPPPKKNKQ